MKYLLGIDFGGGASKATLLGEDGTIAAVNTVEYPTFYPKPGFAEQDPADWVKATCENIQAVLKKSGINPAHIAALSLDAATHTAVIMDEDFHVLRNAIYWTDTRSTEEVQYLKDNYSDIIEKQVLHKSEIALWSNSDIGCDVSKCGLLGSPTRVLQTFENDKGKRRCKFISRSELYPLIERLKGETPKYENHMQAGQKLPNVWAVGKETMEAARTIAQNVVLIEKAEPEEIAARAKIEKPEVILWNADYWGRKNAPIAAAILNTGLCADCTELETDGNELFMIRPAGGGSITAKIRCLTRPQMATVRTAAESSQIIVSAGRGVKKDLERVKDFCKKIGAELGASRGLVDEGAVPYEKQIGFAEIRKFQRVGSCKIAQLLPIVEKGAFLILL